MWFHMQLYVEYAMHSPVNLAGALRKSRSCTRDLPQ